MKFNSFFVVCSLLLCVILSNPGCKRRSGGSSVQDLGRNDILDLTNPGRSQYQGEAGGVDTNDVTWIFPLPTTDEEKSQMLGISDDIRPPSSLLNAGKFDRENPPGDVNFRRTQLEEEVERNLGRAKAAADASRSIDDLRPLAWAMRVSKYSQAIVTADDPRLTQDGEYINSVSYPGTLEGTTRPAKPTFLDKESFDQAILNGEEQGVTFSAGAKDITNWKIVSLRFKPCEGDMEISDESLEQSHDVLEQIKQIDDAQFVRASIARGQGPIPDSTGQRGVFGTNSLRRCSFQVNLIAQPIVKNRFGKFVAEDQALHLLHHFPFAIRGSSRKFLPLLHNNFVGYTTEMAVKLRKIKAALNRDGISTNGTPTGIHPAFKGTSKELQDKYRSVMHEFIKQYFGIGKMNLIAFAGVRDDHTWIFFTQGMSARNAGVSHDSSIIRTTSRLSGGVHPSRRNAPRLTRVQKFSLKNGDITKISPDIVDVSNPALSSVPGVENGTRPIDPPRVHQPLPPGHRSIAGVWDVPGTTGAMVNLQLDRVGRVNEDMEQRDGTLSQRGRSFVQSFIVNNPEASTITEMDCLSCHNVTPRLREEYISGNNNTGPFGLPFEIDHPVTEFKYVPPKGISAFIDHDCAARSIAEVRNLGFFFERCSVGIRAVNESAHQAAFVNLLMGWDNPATKAECTVNGTSQKKALIFCSEIKSHEQCRRDLGCPL